MVPSVVLAFVIAGIALAGFGAVASFAFFAADLPAPEDLARDPLAQTTNVFDREGTNLLYQFEVERREVVPLVDVPQLVIDATVSAEDKSFWTNPGVDIFSIVRAVRDDLLNQEVVSGASTITQQLVKQRIVGGEVSVTRKIKEAILAIQVTRTYSKEQILELYFNQIYYGNQAYGIKAAAQTYFGKADLSTLTVAESALLAGLPQSPSVLDPSKPDNVERAKAALILAGRLEGECPVKRPVVIPDQEAMRHDAEIRIALEDLRKLLTQCGVTFYFTGPAMSLEC